MSPRHSIVPPEAGRDGRLTRLDFQVLIVLGNATNRDGWCRRRQSQIAAEIGVTRVAVNRSLRRLAEIGYVEIHRRRDERGANVSCAYRIVSPPREPELPGFGDTGDPCNPPVTPPSNPSVTSPVTGTVTPPVTVAVTPRTKIPERRDSSDEESLSPPTKTKQRQKRSQRPGPDDGQRELLPVTAVDGSRGEGWRAAPMAASPIAADWTPGEWDRRWAAGKGLTDAEIDEQAERFRDHWLRKPGRDGLAASWNAAWRSWVRGYLDRQEAGGGDHGKGSGHGGGRRAAGLARTEGERLSDAFAALRRRR